MDQFPVNSFQFQTMLTAEKHVIFIESIFLNFFWLSQPCWTVISSKFDSLKGYILKRRILYWKFWNASIWILIFSTWIFTLTEHFRLKKKSSIQIFKLNIVYSLNEAKITTWINTSSELKFLSIQFIYIYNILNEYYFISLLSSWWSSKKLGMCEMVIQIIRGEGILIDNYGYDNCDDSLIITVNSFYFEENEFAIVLWEQLLVLQKNIYKAFIGYGLKSSSLEKESMQLVLHSLPFC